MSIVIIDYGAGNLRSIQKAMQIESDDVVVSNEIDVIAAADKLVLPGVGAFAEGMKGLHARGLVETIKTRARENIPILGICLGMQLFFDYSEELGGADGLGLIEGKVCHFPDHGMKIPHTGWNQLEILPTSNLLRGIPDRSFVYFNHSLYCMPEQRSCTAAFTEYGGTYSSAVEAGNLWGAQFHPEKSQQVGLRILKNFIEV